MIKKLSQSCRSLFFLIMSLCCFHSTVFAYPIAETGEKLNEFLDGLEVTKNWLPNRYVDWTTGHAVGRYQGALGTHCSSFVAAAASKLGVYILRPPDHAYSLANAQYDWLRNQGMKHGWAAVNSHVNAQKIANQGCLVVIAYANPNRARPGHVAIVRPSSKSKEEINSKGPQIIQAGPKNYNSTTLSKAFRHHQVAFKKHKIRYFAHATPYCRLFVKNEDRGFPATKRL